MKKILFCLLLAAALGTRGAEQPKPARGSPPTQGADEYTQLVQEYAAERAKLIEARQTLKTQAKQAKTARNSEALRTAQDALVHLEQAFGRRNADLVRRIKAKESEKKPRPVRPTAN